MKLFLLSALGVSATIHTDGGNSWEAQCQKGSGQWEAITPCGQNIQVSENQGTVCRWVDGTTPRTGKNAGGAYILDDNTFFSIDYGNYDETFEHNITALSWGEGTSCIDENWWNTTLYPGCDLGSVECDYGTELPKNGFYFQDNKYYGIDAGVHAFQFWGRESDAPFMMDNPMNTSEQIEAWNQMQMYNNKEFQITIRDSDSNVLQLTNHSCGPGCTSSFNDVNGVLTLSTSSPNSFIMGFYAGANGVPDLWKSTINY